LPGALFRGRRRLARGLPRALAGGPPDGRRLGERLDVQLGRRRLRGLRRRFVDLVVGVGGLRHVIVEQLCELVQQRLELVINLIELVHEQLLDLVVEQRERWRRAWLVL